MAGARKPSPGQEAIDEAMQRAGGFGFYQFWIAFTIIFGNMSCSFISHGIAYLELQPHYECLIDDIWTACAASTFCGNDAI